MLQRTLWCLIMLCTGTVALAQNQAAVSTALKHVENNAAALGLTAADVQDMAVSDAYVSKANGVTHVYLTQQHQGIGVYNAQLNVAVSRQGNVLHVSNRFVPNLAGKVNTAAPGLGAEQAVQRAAQALGKVPQGLLRVQSRGGAAQAAVFNTAGISLDPIEAKLVYQPMADGSVRLAWNVDLYPLDGQNYWKIRTDAGNGALLAQDDLVDHDTYRVYPDPAESPLHPVGAGTPHTLVANPANATASPFGWHDTNGAAGAEFTDTRGNNVDAYADRDGNNTPDPGSRPSGGASLDFDFAIDLNQQPSAYTDGAVVNLFFWNNFIHDVTYQYGFDEASGNFQVNNYGNGGNGNDDVRAEAQDNDLGGSNCNANFFTPTDGNRPRMQMFTCNNASPERDGDLDNGVIVHEYGHGISNRLTGGPSNSGCLSNTEQMGEGWSDWYALMLTQQSGDTATQGRGIGTYLFGQAANGPGIRARPYSTDFGVNEFTYSNITTASIPHGIGHVWATMLWDLNWALIGDLFPTLGGGDNGAGGGSGFNSDLYSGTGGNNLALQLITDGMKLQPCSPGFVDGRDAILLADDILTGDGNINTPDGANVEIIWNVFARRGLGWSASQGSSGSRTDGTEAFDLPPFLSNATDVHVENIITGQVNAGGNKKRGTATITIHDDLGAPRAGFTVTGNFSGDFNETGASGVTAADGTVTLTTSSTKKGNVSVSFCVSDVSGALPYDPNDNASASYACSGGGTPTDVHVAAISTGQQNQGGGNKAGTATVTIQDDLGNPVSGYTVTGNFSGDFNESGASGVTGGNGTVTLVTNGSKKGKVNVSFCVSNVSGALPYDPNDNSSGAFACPAAGKAALAASDVPAAFGLEVNYPNPFNPVTMVPFNLTVESATKVTVIDVMGRTVATLVDQALAAGRHEVRFDAQGLPSGLYLVRLEAAGQVQTRRITLLK